jgi:hypothetical protein
MVYSAIRKKNKLKMLRYLVKFSTWRFMFKKMKRIPRETKWFFQRARRGWSDYDVWDLDRYIAGILADSLAYLRDHHCGYPSGSTDEVWIATLDEMSKRFKLLRLDYFDFLEQNIPHDEYKKALDVFEMLKIHFGDLWD